MPGAVSGKKDELVRFIEFYDREYHLVVRFIMNCGAGLTAAEDAAQDAFWATPGILEALIPGRMQGHGGTEEVPG
jgi:hypothetical protein